jgi:membrane protein implicated in regulation of membrane protease activity
MKQAKHERFSIALFNSAVAVSSISMLWLLWHFPIATVMSALLVLAGVVLVAKVAKLESESSNDVSHPNPTA